jgi:hypothetical protein
MPAKSTTPIKKRLERPNLHEVSDICKAVLRKIDADKSKMQPTPERGDVVGWARSFNMRMDGEIAWDPAIVIDVLDPGRLILKVFTASGQDILATSAVYVHHPENLKDANVRVGNGGGWFYRDVMKDSDWQPPKEAFALHARALDRREQLCLSDERRRVDEEIERARRRKAASMQQEASTPAAGK